MIEVEGLKHKLNRKLKISVRSEKNSTRGSEGTEKKWKNSKYETNKAVSDHDNERKSFRSSSNDTRYRSGSGKEGFDGESDRRNENSGFKRKRVYADRDGGQEGRFHNAGVPNWKSSRERGNDRDGSFRGRERVNDGDDSFRGRERGNDRDGSFRGRERENDRDGSFRGRERGNDRDGSFRGREQGNGRGGSFRGRERENDRDGSFRGRERGNDRDGSFRGREQGNGRGGSFRGRERGNGRGDSYRGREKENDKMGFVRRTERGNDRGDSFKGRERRGNDQDGSFRGRERRGNDNDDSFRGGKRGNDRDDSVRGRERRNDKDDSVRGMERRNDGDDSSRGRERRNDRDDSVRGNRNEFSQERNKRDEFRTSRADKGNEDSKISGKRASSRVEGVSVTSEGVSGNKLRATDKRSVRGGAVKLDGGEDGLSKRNSRNKIDATKQVDQKDNEKQELTPLEIAAKKLLRHRKALAERSAVKDVVRKKKKRVIRIDPHDISNKRLDDGISFDGKVVEKKVDTEEDAEVSQNAQFRAIQPSPSILSFVEDNLIGRRRLIELRNSGYNIDLSAPLDNVPFSTSTERERIEESVFRNRLEFYAAAKVSPSFPPPELPEIAFAGRSNVGKSSLLNALTRQWGVVRTSDKPGLTQTINFFKLGPKLSLVDLPGYGFAYAKEEVKDAWEELVKEYVSTRVGLRRVCLLIDTKWGMKPRDHELIDLMERSQTNYQIVLTKTDAVFPIDVARRAMQIEETLKPNRALVEPVMMVSSKTGAGIRNLRTVLSKITRFAKL